MSHPQQQEFVGYIRKYFPSFFEGQRVLEVGSLDINGTVRGNFQHCTYIGLDVGEGPGVDVVCQGQDYGAQDGSFDVVISCEVMEHNPFWKETFQNMARVCRPGGLMIMTCACLGRPEHGTTRTSKDQAPLVPWEYYKNLSAKDFLNSINIKKYFTDFEFFENFDFCDLYFVGFKTGTPSPSNAKRSLLKLRMNYYLENLRHQTALKRRVTISIFGEARYSAGPIRPWPFK